MLLAHTKVYLLALASILVPSVYTALRSTWPASINSSTTWVNTSLMWFFRRWPRKRLMVWWSGRFIPESHMKWMFSLIAASIRREE